MNGNLKNIGLKIKTGNVQTSDIAIMLDIYYAQSKNANFFFLSTLPSNKTNPPKEHKKHFTLKQRT